MAWQLLFKYRTRGQKQHLNTNLRSIEKSQVRYYILSYLAEFRDAEDTLDGIQSWWILDRWIRRVSPIIKETLDELVKEGLVLKLHSNKRIEHENSKHQVCDLKAEYKRIRYQLNQERFAEIQALLKLGIR